MNPFMKAFGNIPLEYPLTAPQAPVERPNDFAPLVVFAKTPTPNKSKMALIVVGPK